MINNLIIFFITKAKKIIVYKGKYNGRKITTEEFVAIEKSALPLLEKRVEIGRLAEGLFHDLINPITSLSLQINKLQSSDKNTENHVCALKNIIIRMNTLLWNIKKVINELEVTDINNICKISDSATLIRDLYEHQLNTKSISLNISILKDFSVPIHCIRLNQLMMNLVSNSIESFDEITPKNNKLIHLIISQSSICGFENAIIKVNDNGVGMDKKQIKLAFKTPFSTKKDGSGIGLMTINQIVVSELRGHIYLKSKKKKGTRIKIIFPLSTKKKIITRCYSFLFISLCTSLEAFLYLQ